MQLKDAIKARRGKRRPPSHPRGIRRLQVGTGPKHLRDEWWNTDLRPFNGLDEAMNAAEPWPYTGILTHVYAEHFLEHLHIEDALRFFVNAGQALKQGGRIRLSTPSLEWVMVSHFRFDRDDDDARIMDTLKTNRAFHGWGHQFLWSRPMLQKVITSLGYTNLTWHDYGVSPDPVFDDMEAHGGWSQAGGFPSVWIVEAERGKTPIAPTPEVADLIETEFTRHVRAGH